jgi:hypothetical protein
MSFVLFSGLLFEFSTPSTLGGRNFLICILFLTYFDTSIKRVQILFGHPKQRSPLLGSGLPLMRKWSLMGCSTLDHFKFPPSQISLDRSPHLMQAQNRIGVTRVAPMMYKVKALGWGPYQSLHKAISELKEKCNQLFMLDEALSMWCSSNLWPKHLTHCPSIQESPSILWP